MTPFLARHERFERVGSTNDVVREWLAAGTPEVCLAVADEQTAGRGREGRRWLAPPGAALLRVARVPTRLARARRHVAAGRDRVGRHGRGRRARRRAARRHDPAQVAQRPRPRRPAARIRKIAGVLGETDGLGTRDPRAVIGIGVNTDWAAADFPPDLAASMTSLREAAGGRPVDSGRLLDAFLERLEPSVEALRAGDFAGRRGLPAR